MFLYEFVDCVYWILWWLVVGVRVFVRFLYESGLTFVVNMIEKCFVFRIGFVVIYIELLYVIFIVGIGVY